MTHEYKYLGITLDEHLKFYSCITALLSAGGQALGAIISKFEELENVGYNTYTKLYNSGVAPILEYSCAVWPCAKANEIYLCAFRFWNRLFNMEDFRLTKQIFYWDFVNQRGWTQDIRHLLIQLDLEYAFSEKIIIDMNLVKSKLNELMYEQWSNEVHNKPKLRTYVQIKDTFEPEPYVLSNINRQRRSLLTQIRLGILPVKIETGRFRSLSLDQMICELCEMQKVENEIHFIFECPLYNNLGKRYMNMRNS